MSMLDRYRKPGGFMQLLALIETCNQAKQEKLLEMIAGEDLRWSETVRAKMLTIDRIYSWSDEILAEIFGTLQDLTVAVALTSATPEFKTRVTSFFTHGRIRKIEDLVNSKGPTPAEVAATHMKIVETVRRMGSNGFLRFDMIDTRLVVNEGIDEFLSHQPIPGDNAAMKRFASLDKPKAAQPAAAPGATTRVLHSYSHMNEHMAAAGVDVSSGGGGGGATASVTPLQTQAAQSHSSSEHGESRLMELQQLKKRVADLSKENATLRHDLSIAKSKLDQIKKIA